MPDPIYEGHTAILGQDTSTEPTLLAGSFVSRAVNRAFRGGRNNTRPPFWHIPWMETPELDEHMRILRYGNFQGWMEYKKKRAGRQEGVVVAIAGRLYFLSLVNERMQVEFLIEGNDPKLMHSWFVQAREWVYVQNGKENAILWDGESIIKRANPEALEMPVGTIMVYGHGRVFVTNAYDQIAASDIIYGNGLTDATSTHKFTENTYWAEGGYFGQPTEIGQITGAIVMPRLGSSLNGQGEVLFFSESGASAIEASIPRGLWKDQKVHSMVLNGRGCSAPDSLIAINNDCWFRSEDGYSSYRLSTSESVSKWSLTKMSRFINHWMDKDTDWLIRFNSAINFNNRLIGTVNPETSKARYDDFGDHRYHKGIVSLDIEQPVSAGDSEFAWDGLWTGIRPCSFVRIGKRCFAFSHDSDGENRIYEIKKDGTERNDRVNDQFVQTEWFYLTKRYTWAASQRTNEFQTKQLLGGDIWISEVRDKIKIGIDYRADNTYCWNLGMRETEFGNSFGDTFEFSLPRDERLYMQSPETKCGIRGKTDHGAVFQFLIYGAGEVKIDRFRAAVNISQDPLPQGGPCYKNENKKIGLDCKLENDYGYSIVEAASR